MNLQEIKYNHPRSHEKLCDFLATNTNCCDRVLFDFFDSNNINCTVMCAGGTNWMLEVSMGKLCFDSGYKYKTRHQAESAVFERAFNLMEEMSA